MGTLFSLAEIRNTCHSQTFLYMSFALCRGRLMVHAICMQMRENDNINLRRYYPAHRFKRIKKKRIYSKCCCSICIWALGSHREQGTHAFGISEMHLCWPTLKLYSHQELIIVQSANRANCVCVFWQSIKHVILLVVRKIAYIHRWVYNINSSFFLIQNHQHNRHYIVHITTWFWLWSKQPELMFVSFFVVVVVFLSIGEHQAW